MYLSDRTVASLAACAAAAVFLFAWTLIASDDAGAQSTAQPHAAASPVEAAVPRRGLWELPPLRAQVEPGDDIAALDAIETALTQAGDGAVYVWRRDHGRLSGAVRPTSTFRDADRRICRHLEMELRLGTYTRRIEGIACRGADRVWVLEG